MRPLHRLLSRRSALTLLACCVLGGATLHGSAAGATLEGTTYRIDPSVAGASGGGDSSAGALTLTATAGEAFVGTTDSAGATTRIGYAPQLPPNIQISLDATSVDFGSQLPGTPTSRETIVSVTTEAAAYQLLVHQDHDLRHTDAVTNVPPIGASVASPQAWSDGVTTGFGVGVVSGTSVDPKWQVGGAQAYAGLTSSAQVLHAPAAPGVTDVTTVRYRLDVSTAQKAGTYSNSVTFSAIAVP